MSWVVTVVPARPRAGTHFVEGGLQVLGGDGARVVEGARRQGVVGDAVDLPGQAAGSLEQCFCGGRLEQRQLAAGQLQTVGEVGVEFVALQAAEMMAHDQALAERFV